MLQGIANNSMYTLNVPEYPIIYDESDRLDLLLENEPVDDFDYSFPLLELEELNDLLQYEPRGI